jgi:hypothetical protein
MSIVSVHNFEVQPGRTDDFIALMREGKPHVERLAVNLESIRLFRVATAGPQTGNVILAAEYADRQSYAATITNEAQDADFQNLLRRSFGPDAPATEIGHTIHVDLIPPVGSRSTRAISHGGRVLWVALADVKPGRLDDLVAVNRAASELAHAAGAERVTCRAITIGGPMTNTVVSVAQYADLAAWAECAPGSEKLANNPDWQDLVTTVLGPDGPVVAGSLRIGLLMEIEL